MRKNRRIINPILKESKSNIEWIGNKKYIWVEGYKATDENMRCRDDEQYELNVLKSFNGEPRVSESGFHFCPNLKEIPSYGYSVNGKNRFFKVKALVPYEVDPTRCRQLSAKKIILVEELTYENIKSFIQLHLPLVKNEKDYKTVGKIGYEVFKQKIYVKMLQQECGFTETFSNILFYKADGNSDALDKVIELSKALKEENISKDMLVYLALEEAYNYNYD